MIFLRHSAATDVGLQRENNEDAFYCAPKQGLWIVADGMGGHEAGEVASQITIDSIANAVNNHSSLDKAIQQSHRDILSAAAQGIGSRGMGSTVVAVKTRGSSYEVGWVGDSRAYLWGRSQKALTQLTTDHSYVQMLYESGAISAAEREIHPERNIITQCLGSLDLPDVRVDRVAGKWPANSILLLCSDGLSDIVHDMAIAEILNNSPSLEKASADLIQAALNAGGKDNITVIIIASPNALESFCLRGISKVRSLLGR